MKKIIVSTLLILSLIVSSASASLAQVQPVGEQEYSAKVTAFYESIFYNVNTGELELVEEIAAEKYSFTKNELAEMNSMVDSVTKEEVDQLIKEHNIDLASYEGEVLYNENGDELIQPFAFIYLVGIGLILISAYFFYSRYLDYKEKMTLINRCYDRNGDLVVDSRDKSGVKGKPNEGDAKRVGGYNFACKK